MTKEEIINEIKPILEELNYPDAVSYLTQNDVKWLNENIKALEQAPITKNDLAHNLCNSCTNIGCEFQSGIVRMKCAFYMPPHIETDNCGNYVVIQPDVTPKDQYEARLKADMVDMLGKIRAEIENHCGLTKENHCRYCSYCNSVMGVREILEIIDKYKAESKPQESEE